MAKFWLSMSLVILMALVLGGLAFMPSASSKAGEPQAGTAQSFKPVAPLLVVMENVDDLYGEFPKMIREKDKDKDKEKKQLERLKKESQFLSELFNVAYYHKPEKDWQDWAVKNREQFLKLAGQCDQGGDTKSLKATLDAIDATCEACHEKYRDKEKGK
jgi:cytochrome c556